MKETEGVEVKTSISSAMIHVGFGDEGGHGPVTVFRSIASSFPVVVAY